LGPLRLNLSRAGIGCSVGVKGLRIGAGLRGPYVSGGHGGVYFRESLNAPREHGPHCASCGEPDSREHPACARCGERLTGWIVIGWYAAGFAIGIGIAAIAAALFIFGGDR
jgi:hypothetical protein